MTGFVLALLLPSTLELHRGAKRAVTLNLSLSGGSELLRSQIEETNL